MAKKESDELLERWRKAEERYRQAADQVLGGTDKLTKATVVDLAQARAKADKRMHEYLADALR